jgi:Flp pilus assembly protein TadG
MKRLLKYYKEKKGISLVLIALFLAVLLMLLGVAVDLSYMYYVKNQLQVAADAASLAGAANLSGSGIAQPGARSSAWQFACKNRAADNPKNVFLVTAPSNPDSPTCDNTDTPPNLNNGNDFDGDIVVGNWNPNRPQTPVDLRFRPTAGNPLLAGDAINAVKVVARRTGDAPVPNVKIGYNAVRVFIGQVFRLIGINWSYMSARASAIASYPPVTYGPLPICIDTCANLPQTPLTGTPQGVLLKMQTPSHELFDPEWIAWTDLRPTSEPGAPKSKRNKPDDPPGIQELLGVEFAKGNWIVKQPEPPRDDYCNTGVCLRTQQGVSNELAAFPAIIAARGKTYTLKGYSVFGWRTFIPVFEPCSPDGPPNPFACPGDQPHGYRLVQVAEVIVTQVKLPAGPGEPGIYIVGLDDNPAYTDPDKTKIKCIPCDDPTIQSSEGVHLVK